MYYSVDIFFRNVHHLSDARFAAGIWAKWISFNFDKTSKDYISPIEVAEILPWVSGPEIVAEFGEENSKENIEEICALLKIKSILISDDRKSDLEEIKVEILTKESFTRDVEDSRHQFFPINIEEDIKVDEKVKIIAIQGIFEEKPGSADYQDLSAFLEHFED